MQGAHTSYILSMHRVRSKGGALASVIVIVACGGEVATGDARGQADASSKVDRDGGGGSISPSTRCGNGIADPGEDCDGDDLNGNNCRSATATATSEGELRCRSDCIFDTTSCKSVGDSCQWVPCGTGGGPYGTGGYPGTGSSGSIRDAGVGGGAGAGGRTGTGGYGGTAGSSYGDPHLFTADGYEYDFQAVGEFVLLEDREDPAFVVQVRQTPFKTFTTLSANTAVAALVAGDRVAVYAGQVPPCRVDGTPTEVHGALDLPHGGHVQNAGEVYTVTWPTGESIIVNATWSALLNVSYKPPPAGSGTRTLRGLLGTPDGDPSNDLTTRAGVTLLTSGGAEEIYDVFGRSYRIDQAESLFDYGRGEDTASFTDVGFPHGDRSAAALSTEDRRRAFLTCALAGVKDVAALEACTADVGLTGDPGFARSAAAHEARP